MDRPHRKTRRRREIENDGRFLTFSCYGRLPLFSNILIRDTFMAELAAARERHKFRLIAWVIMPEHVHVYLVARPTIHPDGSPVDRILWGLKKPFSQRVISRWEELNARVLRSVTDPDGQRHFWLPGGGHDENIRSDEQHYNTVNYIHENPVTRGLVSTPIDWAWSSARWYAGVREGQIPLDVV